MTNLLLLLTSHWYCLLWFTSVVQLAFQIWSAGCGSTGSTELQNEHCYNISFGQRMLEEIIKLVVKNSKGVEERVVRNKLSFTFSM